MSSVKKSDVWLCDNCFSLSSHFQTFGIILQFSQFFQEKRFLSYLIGYENLFILLFDRDFKSRSLFEEYKNNL